MNFYGKYIPIIKENEDLDYNTFNKYFDILPINYLIITEKNNYISFKINNSLIKKSIKDSINYEIETQSIKNLISSNECDRCELKEKLLTLFNKNNKLEINNLVFDKKNILEVEEIYQFINYDGVFIQIGLNKSINDINKLMDNISNNNNFRQKFIGYNINNNLFGFHFR